MASLSTSQPSEDTPSCSSPLTVEKSLLSSFMKASFSMSSLRDGISPDKDSPVSGADPATLPRRKHQDHLRRISHSKDKKDEFWEALQPDYNYLMDHGLIDTCKEAKGELFWEDEFDKSNDTWNFNEFIMQHDRLCTWIEQMEMEVMKPEGACLSHLTEIKTFTGEIKLMNEQAQRLIRKYPPMSDEISQRMEHLNGLWDTLQHCLTSIESQDEKAALRREIACQMRLLRKWIRGIEEQLEPLRNARKWEPGEIDAKTLHHQEIHKQIESHGKSVLTVIKLCERFRDQERANCGSSGDFEKQFRGSNQALRTATNLQKRFHALWIRSLEWQCLLEELRGSTQRHTINTSIEDDSESDCRGYEPYRKYPRLTTGYRNAVPMQDNVDHAGQSQNVIVTADSATLDEAIVPVEQEFGRRPPDHQDVGYSSENSAHLSNEESAGECVRVYTYTSATATSPRVLEVVMDGECRPRRTPPRDVEEGSDARSMLNLADTSPNCATFYFQHEDSDTDRYSTGTKIRLDFGQERPDKDDHSLEISGIEDTNDEESDSSQGRGRCPDRIHKLVNEVDHLVNRPRLEEEKIYLVTPHLIDSSCDASGEYTSSNDSDADSCSSSSSSASTLSQDQKGSVIHLKMITSTPITVPAELNKVTSDPGSANSVVRMRTKKRRNGDRPWSVVELMKPSDNQLNLSHFSNSENSLHHLSRCRTVAKDCITVAKEGDSSSGPRQLRKPTTRRRNSKQVDSSSDDKCHSLGSQRHSSSSENGCRNSMSVLQKPCFRLQSDLGEPEAMEEDHNIIIDPINASTTMQMDSENSPLPHIADELSTLSEQAWDDYQDLPYLSEPYSEPNVDDEIVRRIWDFGDDYHAVMESHSDGTSTPSFPSRVRTRQRQTSTKVSSNSRESSVLDSESDFDDLTELIEQHQKQLRLTELQLNAEKNGDPSERGRHKKISEVLATCQIHLKCLQKVWKQLGEVKLKPLDLNLGIQQAGEQLKLGWERLLLEANDHEMRLMELNQLQNKFMGFHQKVTQILDKAASVSERVVSWNTIALLEQALTNTISKIVEIIGICQCYDYCYEQASNEDNALCLSEIKQDMTNLNFKIHNFINRTGLDVCCLKKEVVVLYKLWNQAQDVIQEKLLWLRHLDAAWKEYGELQDRLKVIVNEDEHLILMLAAVLKNSPDSLAPALPAFTEFSNVSELKEKLCNIVDVDDYHALKSSGDSRTCLNKLAYSSDELTRLLGKGCAAEEVEMNTRKMAENVAEQHDKCQQLVGKMAGVLKIRSKMKMRLKNYNGGQKYKRNGRRASSSMSSHSSPTLLWRVIRAALPIQLAVVILFCFACLFEPHCCDSVNNLNLSLTPQLRYVRGPPPI